MKPASLPKQPSGRFHTRQCTATACRFRFPVAPGDPILPTCPLCGSPLIQVAEYPLSAEHFLPEQAPDPAPPEPAPSAAVHILLDNIRSAWNVGSIFRSADGAGASHLYLCGITPTPLHPGVLKTALGAESSLAWSQHRSAYDLAVSLRSQGASLWALENSPQAVSLFSNFPQPQSGTIVLIVGNEICGVDPEVLAHCERALYIPMGGIKGSLNVAVACGIAIYTLMAKLA